jgi:hypothetical protein
LLAGANQITASAQREGVVERNAHHRVESLPTMDHRVENLDLVSR